MRCAQPVFGCYCEHIQRINSKIKFVILIHPIEAKRRIATGRMSHLCLENSELIRGQNYTNNGRVNRILADPSHQPFVLYPGRTSMDLSEATEEQKASLFSANRTPVVFVIDGTWATARKMVRQSLNINSIPRICFTPANRSRFLVRKQPRPDCYSTIEAIHQTIELLGSSVGFDISERKQDSLLCVFNKMVERQLSLMRDSIANPRATSYRRQRIS